MLTVDDILNDPVRFGLPEDYRAFEREDLFRRRRQDRELAVLAQHFNADREALVKTYTSGCCGILAEVLRQRLGWEVWGVVASLWNNKYPVHLVVRDPATGLFADAHGFGQTEDEITE